MYTKIIELEEAFNELLPDKRLNRSPGTELLAAGHAWREEVWRTGQELGPLLLTDTQINAGKNLARHPIYVCGVHRSGTTLMRDLLDGHPQLCVLPSEGSFLTSLAKRLQGLPADGHQHLLATEWLWRLVNPINQPPYWLLGNSTAGHSPYVDFVRALSSWYTIAETHFKPFTTSWPHLAVMLAYATCTNNLGAKYWVDKTPTYEKYLDTIWREMPQTKVIHVLRNPTDVLLSRKAMEHGLNIKQCLTDMQLSYQTAAQHLLETERFLYLRYEEICEAPQAAISRMSGFLNIDQDPCLFTPSVAGKLTRPNSSFSPDLPVGAIVKERAVTGSLSANEVQLLSAYLGKVAQQMGYAVKSISQLQSRLTKLRYQLQRRLQRKFP